MRRVRSDGCACVRVATSPPAPNAPRNSRRLMHAPSGDDIVTAYTSTWLGPESPSLSQHEMRAMSALGKTDICSAAADVRFTLNSDRESGYCKRPCPLYTQKRTCAVQLGMSA